MVPVLNLLIDRKETSFTRFWYCTSHTAPLQQHCTGQSWTSLKAVWPPRATHTHTHPCLQLWTGVKDSGWSEFFPPKKQGRSEDYFWFNKGSRMRGCFPFPSPNHVLSCWLELLSHIQGVVKSTEEGPNLNLTDTATLTEFRKVMAKWAVWSDANLMAICLGNSVGLMFQLAEG